MQRRVAEVVLTRGGAGIPPNSRYFLIDFAGGELYAEADEEHWDYEVSASVGFIRAYTVAPNDHINGKRIGIEYHPEGGQGRRSQLPDPQIRQGGDGKMGLSLGCALSAAIARLMHSSDAMARLRMSCAGRESRKTAKVAIVCALVHAYSAESHARSPNRCDASGRYCHYFSMI